MRALVEGIREGGQLIANQIIVIRRAECLLSVDAKTFSLICRLRQLAQNPSIGLVLMSTNLWQEFHGISAGLEPLIFSTRQITTAGLASRLEIDLGSTGTEKVPFRRFLDFTCSIVRSQMNELPLVVDFMKKYYPIFMATDKEGRLVSRDVGQLYKKSESEAAKLLKGENLQEYTLSLIRSLSFVEKYLLVACYLGTHNSAKHDLDIFGSCAGKRKRTYKKTALKQKLLTLPLKKTKLKPVGLERLLAIFYFIYQAGLIAPPKSLVMAALNKLIDLRLLARTTPFQRLDNIKIRSNFGPALLSKLCKDLSFEYEKFVPMH